MLQVLVNRRSRHLQEVQPGDVRTGTMHWEMARFEFNLNK